MNYSLPLHKLFEITLITHFKNAKMAGRIAIETVKKNSDQAKQIIEELKNEAIIC